MSRLPIVTAFCAALALSPAAAATLSVTGTGGAVPDGEAVADVSGGPAGEASFDIVIADPRVVAASGNNVTLSLFGLRHPYVLDLAATLEFDGASVGQVTVFDQVLRSGNIMFISALDGDYTFNSGESASLRSVLDSFAPAIPSGAYRPTLSDDVTTSPLSSAWNGLAVAGTWRLRITDSERGGVTNADWTWKLDIEVEDAPVAPIPLPAAGWLMLAGLGALASLRRRAA